VELPALCFKAFFAAVAEDGKAEGTGLSKGRQGAKEAPPLVHAEHDGPGSTLVQGENDTGGASACGPCMAAHWYLIHMVGSMLLLLMW